MSAVIEQVVYEDVWRGLYGGSWKGLICDDAFAHPAKFSRALIRKIYDHVISEGWAINGSSVVDPFGGVALGAHDAMRHGLNWYGCELEEKFVDLGNQNIALWNNRFSRMPNWGMAQLLQGDSRKLAEVLSTSTCAVSSPPYVLARQDTTRVPPTLGHIYGEDEQERIAELSDHRYGQSEGQLGAMKEGNLNLAISSPPFVTARQNTTRSRFSPGQTGDVVDRQHTANNVYADESPGQLGAMPEGRLCVSSPPYEGNTKSDYLMSEDNKTRQRDLRRGFKQGSGCFRGSEGAYGQSEGQLGIERGETFWSASRLILEQLHQVIVPGGHAVFVVKAFVRDKKIVDFPGQWAQLCEAVGFRLLHHHRASLVEHSGTQGGFHEDKEIRVERKSFFRRLAEAKGSPRIDHESILCFERP